MLRLDIQIEHGRISIGRTPPLALMSIKRPQVKVDADPPVLDIDVEFPRVEVDAREALADLGLKPGLEVEKERAQLSRETALEGIARRVREGEALSAIEKGVRVAEVTAEAAWPEDTRELNVDVAPKRPPEVTVRGGVQFSTLRGDVSVDTTHGWLSVVFRWGRVTTELAQKPSIDVYVVGNRFSVLG